MIEKKCKICGKSFLVKRNHYDKRFCCSKKCMSIDYSNRFSGKSNPNFKNAGLKICLICGKEYKSYNKNRRYCSKECSGIASRLDPNKTLEQKRKSKPEVIYKKHLCKICGCKIHKCRTYCKEHSPYIGKVIKICNKCGIEYNCYPSQNIKYCSFKCSIEDRYKDNNSNWRGGKREIKKMIRCSRKNRDLIKKILKRDNYTCKKCGKVGWELEVDHIKQFNIIFREFIKANNLENEKDEYIILGLAYKYEEFWDENNLRTLCKKHNRERSYK